MRFLGLGKNRTPEYYDEVKKKELDQKYSSGRNRYISWKFVGIFVAVVAIVLIIILAL